MYHLKEESNHVPICQRFRSLGGLVLSTGLSSEAEERRVGPVPPHCPARDSPVELVMGTTAAELRLLWSPFSCPSAEAPLKHKRLG